MIDRQIDELLTSKLKTLNFREIEEICKMDSLKIKINGKSYLNFSSNDYLSLSSNPEVIESAKSYADRYGTGSLSSRLVTGNHDYILEIEHILQNSYKKESALIFNSGYQLNYGVLKSFEHLKNIHFICDKLVHASIIDGVIASGHSFSRFNHNNIEHLQNLIKKNSKSEIVVIFESLYSMEGDEAAYSEIIKLKDQFKNITLYCDIAHSVGMLGTRSLGLEKKQIDKIDFIVGTFGKALASSGSFIISSNRWRDYFINYCRSFIYSTSISPLNIGAIKKALELIDNNYELWQNSMSEICKKFYSSLEKLGINTENANSHIIPLVFGDNKQTLNAFEHLKKKGFWAVAIRTPTVPENKARLRITANIAMNNEMLDEFIDACKSIV